MWQGLVGNLAVFALVISLWSNSQALLETGPTLTRKLMFAGLMAIAVIATMAMTAPTGSGAYFDLRSAVLTTAGLFGGPWVALSTALAALGERALLGGPSIVPGLVLIAMSATIGTVCHYLTTCDVPRRLVVVVWALLTGGAYFVLGLAFGGLSGWQARLDSTVPVAVMNSAAALLAYWAITSAGRARNERNILLAAIEQAPDFFYIKDLGSRFIAVNRKVAEHHGFTDPRQMAGKSDFDLEPGVRARGLIAAEQELVRTGQPLVDAEETVLDEQGKIHHYVTSKVPLKDADGRVVALAGITRDTTAWRAQQLELAEARNLSAYATREMSDGLALFDRNGVLLFCNQRYVDSFPLTAGLRTTGANLRDILRASAERGEQIGIGTGVDRWIESVMASLEIGGDEESSSGTIAGSMCVRARRRTAGRSCW